MMKVLISDDNTKAFDAWTDTAFVYDIELVCHENWEDAKLELEENWNEYDMLILDGRGKLTMDGDVENAQHVIKPVNWLSEMRGKGKALPTIVYTAYLENIEEIVHKSDVIIDVLDKGKVDFDNLCTIITDYVLSNPDYKLKTEHPELFELFDLKLLNDDYIDYIREMIYLSKGVYEGNVNDVFRCIRPVLENTFYVLNGFDVSVVANKYLKKGSIDIRPVISYLAGNPKFNRDHGEMQYSSEQLLSSSMYSLLLMLNDTTSGEAMHHSDDSTNNYMVASAINALFAYLNWYLDFVKTHYIK